MSTPAKLVEQAMQDVEAISCEDFRALEAGDDQYVTLDVREQDEFDAGHIEGAVHIPRGLVEFKIEEAVPDKETQIIICCARGGRAALAGQSLQKIGYTNIKFLEGGYTGYCA